MKRKIFLTSFLKALGAVRIIWGDVYIDRIYGTVVYDETDPEERQDFVWHMTENNVPSEDLRKVIDYLSNNNLIDIDKIITPINELNFDFIDQSRKEEVFDELFNIVVRMIDDGEETDSYFIHD
jgi:hypothetical protein